MSLSEPVPDDTPYFEDDLHAYHAGFLTGALIQAGFQIIVETDDGGNYTGIIEISLPVHENGLEPIRVHVKVLP